jgi:outer membrane protein
LLTDFRGIATTSRWICWVAFLALGISACASWTPRQRAIGVEIAKAAAVGAVGVVICSKIEKRHDITGGYFDVPKGGCKFHEERNGNLVFNFWGTGHFSKFGGLAAGDFTQTVLVAYQMRLANAGYIYLTPDRVEVGRPEVFNLSLLASAAEALLGTISSKVYSTVADSMNTPKTVILALEGRQCLVEGWIPPTAIPTRCEGPTPDQPFLPVGGNFVPLAGAPIGWDAAPSAGLNVSGALAPSDIPPDEQREPPSPPSPPLLIPGGERGLALAFIDASRLASDERIKDKDPAVAKKATKEALQRHRPRIRQLALENGATLVVEKNESGLLYAPDSADMTNAVLSNGAFKPVIGQFAYANLQKALHAIQEGQRAKAQLKMAFDAKQKELDAQQQELKQTKAQLDDDARSGRVSQAELTTRKADLQKHLEASTTFWKDSQKQLADEERRLTQEIFAKMAIVIRKIAERQQLGCVIDLNESGLLFAQDQFDITQEVIRDYDANHP